MVAVSESEQIFEHYQPASWTVGGRRVVFPVISIHETGGNRIIERERPYRDGAKLDDTGSEPVRWVLRAEFENSIAEPGLEQNPYPLYPDALNALVASFAVRETGDLVIPTVGKRRCRAKSYERDEEFAARDQGCLVLTFVEDNEDYVDFSALAAPTASASARRLGEATVFSAQSAGAWHPSIADFVAVMSQLEAIANAPGQVNQDFHYAAAAIRDSSARTRAAYTRLGTPGRDALARPEGSQALVGFEAAKDVAARGASEGREGPKVVALVATQDTSLFQVAALAKQSLPDLVDLNPQLDAAFVPQGATVRVYAEAAK